MLLRQSLIGGGIRLFKLIIPEADKGSLRTLTLREGVRSGDRMVMLTVSGNPSYALNQKQINVLLRL